MEASEGQLSRQRGQRGHHQLAFRLLQAAIDHDIRSIVVIIDQGTAVEVGKELLKWLFERVTILLDKADDIGVMIADKPGGGPADEGRWLAETLKLTNDGIEYVKPGKIVLPILTAPSRHVPTCSWPTSSPQPP